MKTFACYEVHYRIDHYGPGPSETVRVASRDLDAFSKVASIARATIDAYQGEVEVTGVVFEGFILVDPTELTDETDESDPNSGQD